MVAVGAAGTLLVDEVHMRNILIVAFGLTMTAGLGCQDNKNQDSMSHKQDKASMSAGDACTHCPGVQTATADGKCSMCKMDLPKK